ncbi:hypothetical protein HFP15_27820 [Amycolatopsis sp. K13G38]|uniref:Uncharacterized protein n=1 Tax=Amycolatopsis acididurans TaxID=2724524 RepID=A0ABX1JA76_9PSEU|nr:hypothetical protein [Amycolatopsis acididurans]NKQ56687.1 hypothetical protein [Amycolatopsis acididurans]
MSTSRRRRTPTFHPILALTCRSGARRSSSATSVAIFNGRPGSASNPTVTVMIGEYPGPPARSPRM